MLLYPTGPVDALVASAAESHPSRPAVVAADGELTFAQLNTRVSAFASALQQDVAGPGDVVALASPLHPDFVVAFHGILRAGAVVAPINPFMREGDLQHLLATSRARAAVLTPALLAQLLPVRALLPDLRTVILIAPGAATATGHDLGFPELVERHLGAEPARRPCDDPDGVAAVLFTSGTTGPAKGVLLTRRNLLANAAHVVGAHRLGADSVVLNFLPKYHLLHLNSALYAGATQVLHAADGIAESVDLANRARATHYYTIPMRLARLASEPALSGLRLDTVRMIASGGSALAPSVATALSRQFGVPVFQGYGLAETSSMTHSDGPEAPKPGSVGPVLPDTECRIVALDSGAVLTDGTDGEVQVRGPQVMKGYVAGSATGSGLDADGWLATGDVGHVDGDGYLFLVDRIKDVFKCDNFLVSPSEIEQALAAHPAVRECLVVDVPDEFSGAVAAAFVAVAPEAATPEAVAGIVTEVNSRQPYYKHLRHVEVVTRIPRVPIGKPDRKRGRADMAGRYEPRADYPTVSIRLETQR